VGPLHSSPPLSIAHPYTTAPTTKSDIRAATATTHLTTSYPRVCIPPVIVADMYRISRRQQPYDQHAFALPAFVVQSPWPVAHVYLSDTHAAHVRSCACLASAGGSSSALKRRVRLRGTGRAIFVRGRTQHPWDRVKATPNPWTSRFPSRHKQSGGTHWEHAGTASQ